MFFDPGRIKRGLKPREQFGPALQEGKSYVLVIDRDNCQYFQKGKCKVCEKMCQPGAIDYTQEDKIIELDVGNIILATGYDLFDPRRITQYGYGRLANVFTSLEFERLSNSAGPTNGNIVLRDGVTVPKTVAIVHCVGSRDRNYNNYCSSICCMQSLKFAHLVKEKTGAEVYNFYIDIRTPAKGYEEFYHRLLEEGTHFVRGKVAEISDAVRLPGGDELVALGGGANGDELDINTVFGEQAFLLGHVHRQRVDDGQQGHLERHLFSGFGRRAW